MKFRDCRLLTDENIHTQVVAHLRAVGFDVKDVREENWLGRSDFDLLAIAVAERRVVVTHDSDFGLLAVRTGCAMYGALYLRPGHLRAPQTIAMIESMLALDFQVVPPFIAVVQRSGEDVTVRVRGLPPQADDPSRA